MGAQQTMSRMSLTTTWITGNLASTAAETLHALFALDKNIDSLYASSDRHNFALIFFWWVGTYEDFIY